MLFAPHRAPEHELLLGSPLLSVAQYDWGTLSKAHMADFICLKHPAYSVLVYISVSMISAFPLKLSALRCTLDNMFSRGALTYALAILSLSTVVEPAARPEVKNLIVDTDLFDAIEYGDIACLLGKS